MTSSRLFSIDEQIQLNAMYLFALLHESGIGTSLQDLVLSFYLTKHSTLLSKLTARPTVKQKEQPVYADLPSSYSPVVSETFKTAVHYLMRLGLVAANVEDGTLVYSIRKNSSPLISVPEAVSKRVKNVVELLGTMDRNELRQSIQKGAFE